MIVELYFLAIFVSGVLISSFFKPKALAETVATSFLLGLLFPHLLIYLMNSFSISITAQTFLPVWIGSGLTLLIWRLSSLKNFITQLDETIGELDQKQFIFTLFMAFFLTGLIARGTLNPIWPGDGMGLWAPKAFEALNNQALSYSEGFVKKFPLHVGYPSLHNVGMMINLLTLPMLPAYSIKVFDSYYILMLISFAILFCQLIGLKGFKSFIYGLILTFFAKELVHFIIGGYAEIDMAVYLFISVVGLIGIVLQKEFLYTILATIGLACLIITKNEGIYRAFFILLTFTVFFRKQLYQQRKSLLTILIGCLNIKMFEYLNRPTSYEFNEYYNALRPNFDAIIQRAPLIFKATLYSLKGQGLLKSFWPLGIFTAIYGCFIAKGWSKDQKKIYFFLLTLFFINLSFNIVPSWIADNTENYQAIGREIIGRLNLHLAPILSAACLMIMSSWQEKGLLQK